MNRRILLLAVLTLVSVLSLGAQDAFFESPVSFVETNARFPQVTPIGEGGLLAYQQLVEQTDEAGVLEVYLRRTRTGRSWSSATPVAREIRYEGASVPPVFTITSNERGEVLLATVDYESTGENTGTSIVRLLFSQDEGRTFQSTHTVSGDIRLVNPRVFRAAAGGWYLTMERFDVPANRIVYSYSEDGQSWSELRAFPANVLQTGVQSDVTHIVLGERDLFLFVGENIVPPPAPAGPDGDPIPVPDEPQVYAIYTDDNGLTWRATDPESGVESEPQNGIDIERSVDDISDDELISHFLLRSNHQPLITAGVISWTELAMQRPSVVATPGFPRDAAMVFEAGLKNASANTRQLAYAPVDRQGNIAGNIEIITATTLRRSGARIAYNQPIIIEHEGNIYVVAYIDPLRGGDMRVYQREARGWIRLANAQNQFATFPTAGVINDRVHIFWHGRQGSEPELPTRIVYLEPDQRVEPPIVQGVNFDIGSRSRSDTAAFTWTPQADASGVIGYNIEWSRNESLRLPESGDPVSTTEARFPADSDGPWYLHLRAADRAGNWSVQETVRFFRDTTPPAAVVFDPPRIDEEGYLASNTFEITWDEPEVDVSGDREIVTGYVTDLSFVAPADAPAQLVAEQEVTTPPLEEFTVQPSIARDNYDDGLWALTVSAIDSVGNVGEPAALYMRLNKYVPVTLITTIAAVPDPLGRYALDIVGRGFTANGLINRVIVDEDGRAPFDYVYERGSPGYRIFSDRSMAGPILDNLESGEYFVGLDHAERGITFSSRRLSIERNGTVKFGNYTVLGAPTFNVDGFEFPVLTPVNALAWVIVALLLAVAFFSGTRVVAIAREGVVLRSEAKALITGSPLLLERKERRVNAMREQGIGLRLKFAFFIVVLVMSIVGGVAVGLGTATLNRQRQVLVTGLKDRVDVLLESMVAGAVDPLSSPDLQIVDLEQLPESTRAMQEALYATVTGRVSALADEDSPDSFNYVWGTNDPILQVAGVADPEVREGLLEAEAAGGVARTPIPEDSALFLGRTLLNDPAADDIELMAAVVERLARARVNALVLERQITFEEIDVLRQEITAVEFQGGDASDLELRRQRGRLTLNSLNQQIDRSVQQAILDAAAIVRWLALSGEEARTYVVPAEEEALEAEIEEARQALDRDGAQRPLLGSPVLSAPQFVPTEFDPEVTDHIFFQVVAEPNVEGLPADPEALAQLDARDLDIAYFRGAVRLGVSTDLIVETISDARRDIVQITLLIALAASAAGVLGALLLATIVVIPINKIVNAVEEIRKTKDKTTLEDRPIDVKSRDELYRLADAINEMSRGLKTAAVEEENLRATSELQKMFIPLVQVNPDSPDAKKLTSGRLDHELLEFFGYYEGADDLSGDYFAYDEYAKNKFVFIKSDVSGHGVRAAFMMVEVATMFENRLTEWKRTHKPRLSGFVSDVNMLLEQRGFYGMFAALTVGMIDGETGNITVSHAGDIEQRFYRRSPGRVEEHRLEGAPATGMMSGMAYKEFPFSLSSGDVMILATDGIEESARVLREDEYDPNEGQRRRQLFSEEEAKELLEGAGEPFTETLGYDSKNQDIKEEFSTDRMNAVIEQSIAGGTYELQRFRPSDRNEKLVFDYRGLPSTGETAVTAAMAAEQIWRLEPAPRGVDVDPVRVDRKIHDFLRERFSDYGRFFAHPLQPEDRPDAKNPAEEYLYFGGLLCERQEDDLTILVIRKK